MADSATRRLDRDTHRLSTSWIEENLFVAQKLFFGQSTHAHVHCIVVESSSQLNVEIVFSKKRSHGQSIVDRCKSERSTPIIWKTEGRVGPQAAQCGQNGRDTQRAESKHFTYLNVPKDLFLELVRWRRILSIRFKWKYQRFTYCTYVGIAPGWWSIFSDASFDIGDTLEIAAQCAIAKDDIPAFERALAQLKPFYFDLE